MKNEEVVKAFIMKKKAYSNTGSLSSTGDRLFSYSTCIAEYDKYGNLVFNETKYSTTTSHHQTLLKRNAHPNKIVKDIPRGYCHIVSREERLY